jgi:hypothetical protein
LKDSERKRTEPESSFQRFEDLTKRILSVPKREADAKEEERMRRKDGKPR